MTEECSYCNLRETNPEGIAASGIPRGFCGLCIECGKPGHLRHHPGPIPSSSIWCDRHYKILRFTWPLRIPMLWGFGFVWAVYFAYIHYFR